MREYNCASAREQTRCERRSNALSVFARAALLAALSTVVIFFAVSFFTCVIRSVTACVYEHVWQKKRVEGVASHSSSVPSFGQNKNIVAAAERRFYTRGIHRVSNEK